MALTIQDRFGANASINNSNPADPILQIKYSDLASASWDNLQSGDENNPDKWLMAIVRHNKNLENTLTTEEHNVTVTPPFNPALGNRNNTNIRSYAYTVTGYIPDTGSSEPDIDDI